MAVVTSKIGNPSSISKWLIAAIASGVLFVQVLLWHQLSFDQFRLNMLCSAILVYLVWSKREKLRLESSPFATSVGTLLVLVFLARCNTSPGRLFISLAPLLWGGGVALIASGFKGLRQFRQELIVFACLTLPFVLRWVVIDTVGVHLGPITAKAAVAVVRVFGLNPTLDYDVVGLPTGALGVEQGCCGVKSMFFCFGVSIILLLVVPPAKRLYDLIVPVVALVVAFLVNIIRVAFLINLVNVSNHDGFHYWHEGNGSAAFDVAPVILFMLLYRFVVLRPEAKGKAETKEAVPCH